MDSKTEENEKNNNNNTDTNKNKKKKNVWKVTIHRRVFKALEVYPKIQKKVELLYNDLRYYGAILPIGKWPNFSKLSDGRYHCHLKKGNPTFVAVWIIKDKEIKLLELNYVGTHEDAPY